MVPWENPNSANCDGSTPHQPGRHQGMRSNRLLIGALMPCLILRRAVDPKVLGTTEIPLDSRRSFRVHLAPETQCRANTAKADLRSQEDQLHPHRSHERIPNHRVVPEAAARRPACKSRVIGCLPCPSRSGSMPRAAAPQQPAKATMLRP